jgi:hypothetical protein
VVRVFCSGRDDSGGLHGGAQAVVSVLSAPANNRV